MEMSQTEPANAKRRAAVTVREFHSLPVTARRPVSNRLWFYRKQLGYTQKRVAFLLGHRSASRLSNYERGHRMPALATAMKLALILQTPIPLLYPDLHAELKARLPQREKRWLAEAGVGRDQRLRPAPTPSRGLDADDRRHCGRLNINL